MNSLIHHATACIMLLHALLGCCVHHDHCCAAEDVGSAICAADHAAALGPANHESPAGHVDSAGHEGHAATCSHGTDCTLPERGPGGLSHAAEGMAGEGCGNHAGPQSPGHEGPHQCQTGDCVFVSDAGPGIAVELECQWLDSARLVEAAEAAAGKEFAFRAPLQHSPPLAERFQAVYCIWVI